MPVSGSFGGGGGSCSGGGGGGGSSWCFSSSRHRHHHHHYYGHRPYGTVTSPPSPVCQFVLSAGFLWAFAFIVLAVLSASDSAIEVPLNLGEERLLPLEYLRSKGNAELQLTDNCGGCIDVAAAAFSPRRSEFDAWADGYRVWERTLTLDPTVASEETQFWQFHMMKGSSVSVEYTMDGWHTAGFVSQPEQAHQLQPLKSVEQLWHSRPQGTDEARPVPSATTRTMTFTVAHERDVVAFVVGNVDSRSRRLHARVSLSYRFPSIEAFPNALCGPTASSQKKKEEQLPSSSSSLDRSEPCFLFEDDVDFAVVRAPRKQGALPDDTVTARLRPVSSWLEELVWTEARDVVLVVGVIATAVLARKMVRNIRREQNRRREQQQQQQ